MKSHDALYHLRNLMVEVWDSYGRWQYQKGMIKQAVAEALVYYAFITDTQLKSKGWEEICSHGRFGQKCSDELFARMGNNSWRQ